MVARDLTKLSRTVAHALRHRPWIYELELDDEGWVATADLLEALREKRGEWRDLTERDLAEMIASSDKRRYEIEGSRIRALYGHSLAGKLSKQAAEPPSRLYHGTSSRALDAIKVEGLKPMRRQYVHLSLDRETAQEVGARKGGRTVVLLVRAGEAHERGITFYQGNEKVWLADAIPAEFIVLPDSVP